MWSRLYVMYLRNVLRSEREMENFCELMNELSMTRMAMFTSSAVQYSRRCILACDSVMRMIDSTWRTVIGMLPFVIDSRRSSAYSFEILSRSMRVNRG